MLRVPVAIVPIDAVIDIDLTPVDSVDRIKYLVQAQFQIPIEKQTVMINDQTPTSADLYQLASNTVDGITVYVNLEVVAELMGARYPVSVPVGRNTKVSDVLNYVANIGNVISQYGTVVHRDAVLDLNSYVVGSSLYHDGGEVIVRWDDALMIPITVNVKGVSVKIIVDRGGNLTNLARVVSNAYQQDLSMIAITFNGRSINSDTTIATLIRDNQEITLTINWSKPSEISLMRINLIIPPILTRSTDNVVEQLNVRSITPIDDITNHIIKKYNVDNEHRVLLYFGKNNNPLVGERNVGSYMIHDDSSINVAVVPDRYDDQSTLRLKLMTGGNYINSNASLPIDVNQPLKDVTRNLKAYYGTSGDIKLLMAGQPLDLNRSPRDHGIDQLTVIHVVKASTDPQPERSGIVYVRLIGGNRVPQTKTYTINYSEPLNLLIDQIRTEYGSNNEVILLGEGGTQLDPNFSFTHYRLANLDAVTAIIKSR